MRTFPSLSSFGVALKCCFSNRAALRTRFLQNFLANLTECCRVVHSWAAEWNLVPDSHSTALLVLCCTVCCIWKLKSECCEKLCDCCTAIKKQLCKSAVFWKNFVENRGFYALFFKNHLIFDVFPLSKKISQRKKNVPQFFFECSSDVQQSKELGKKRLVIGGCLNP